MSEYEPGAYLIKTGPLGDGKSPVVWFDGTHFWLPGWECALTPSDRDSESRIDVTKIGELVWRPDSRPDSRPAIVPAP